LSNGTLQGVKQYTIVSYVIKQENRLCIRCRKTTPQIILDSDRIMVGKKTKFTYKCLICGTKRNMPAYRGMAESTY